MTVTDERVWLRHKDTGHLWECPAAAVADWTTPEMGWETTDERPPELNPVVAERLAWEADRATKAATTTGRKAKSTES